MSALPHPYAARLRTRPLRQLRAHGPTLRRWRRALLDLRHRPASDDPTELLQWAFDRVPFWQDRFRALGIARHQLADPAIQRALPPTRRADLQAHLHGLIAHPPVGLESAYRGRTSGSTGEPVSYLMGGAAFQSFLPLVELALAVYGARPLRPGRTGIVLLDALGHSPEYGAWMPLLRGTYFHKLFVRRRGWRGRLARLGPQVLTGDPDSLRAALGVRGLRPRIVLSSAFSMPPSLRDELMSHLGCPVVEYYSAQELGPMALGRPDGRSFWVLTPFVRLERATGPSGLPELLVTDRRNPLMPLIRYAVGDLGELAPARPDDLLHAPILSRLGGRAAVVFHRADGRPYDPAGLAPSLCRVPLDGYRLSERAADAADLEYHGPRALTEVERGALEARLSELAGARVHLRARRLLGPLRGAGVKPRPFVPLGDPLDHRARGHHDAPTAGRPRRLYVALTNACNRACPWCSTYSGPERRSYLSEASFRAALPSTGPFELQLEGGEPTLHPALDTFVEIAADTGRCRHLVLCTNAVGVRAGRFDGWPRPLTLKISVNHHLMERDPAHLDRVRQLAEAATEDPGLRVVINLRRRRGGDDDAWVRRAVDRAGLRPLTNDFFLQRYGKAAGDQRLEPPHLVGTDFELINPDGRRFGVDLIARSEAMGRLP